MIFIFYFNRLILIWIGEKKTSTTLKLVTTRDSQRARTQTTKKIKNNRSQIGNFNRCIKIFPPADCVDKVIKMHTTAEKRNVSFASKDGILWNWFDLTHKESEKIGKPLTKKNRTLMMWVQALWISNSNCWYWI